MSKLAQKGPNNLLVLLDKSRTAIEHALPKHITPERMMRVARTAIQTTPDLAKCHPLSVIGSIVEASQLGLEPNGPLGEGYLMPFQNKKTKRTECQFIAGYRGLIKLARQSGNVQSISAEVVYEEDFFEYQYGLNERLDHVPSFKYENPTHAYAICRFKDGGHHFTIMPCEEIESIRNRSPGKNSPAWREHWSEMAKKTAIRRLAKFLQLSPELDRAVTNDEYADAGLRPRAGQIIDVTTEMQAESLKQRLKSSSEPSESPESVISSEEDEQLLSQDKSIQEYLRRSQEAGASDDVIGKFMSTNFPDDADVNQREVGLANFRDWVEQLEAR